MTNCEKCGALIAISKTGKPYCSAKCWLPESERNKPSVPTYKPSKPDNSNTSVVINRTENADSIEWRLTTGKGVKVYCDISKPEEAKTKLLNAIQILQDVDIDFAPVKKPGEL